MGKRRMEVYPYKIYNRGDWSDNSALWTKQLRQELKLSDSNDGVFYMDIGSFMQFFSDVQVCFIKE